MEKSTLATAYYSDLRSLLHTSRNASETRLRANCQTAYRLFIELLMEATETAEVSFSGPFSRLHYFAQQAQLPTADYEQLNDFRVRMKHLDTHSSEELHTHLPYDLLRIALLTERIHQMPMPTSLRKELPQQRDVFHTPHTISHEVMRVVVVDVADDHLAVVSELAPTDPPQHLILCPCPERIGRDFRYLATLVEPGTQLNLVHVSPIEGGIQAELVVIEPDYLIDVTAIAKCFQAYGVSSEIPWLNRFFPLADSAPILLGNLASQLLDEAIHQQPMDYKTSISRFFIHNVLQFIACSDFKDQKKRNDFHTQAMQQQRNLYNMVDQQFARELHLTDPSDVLLEPSFFCELLGVQGRMDMIAQRKHVVVEQKSGKKDFVSRGAVEAHYVQMLLYMAVLHYAFHCPYSALNAHLLYSKFPGREGLIRTENAPNLLHQALRLRNEMAARDTRFAQHGVEDYFRAFDPEQVHNRKAEKLWDNYSRLEYDEFQRALRSANPTEWHYFTRFTRFLLLEQRLAKLGNGRKEGSGFASSWLSTLEEKQQTGNILAPLFLSPECIEHAGKEGISELHLFLASSTQASHDDATTPNFRVGDIVVLYPYAPDTIPDLRRDFVFRATIQSLTPTGITLRLRAPQTNPKAFRIDQPCCWAVEPDYMESSSASLFRGLYAFLSGPSTRRAWLVNGHAPEVSDCYPRQLDHGDDELNHLVAKANAARDYFLLVGPPGTGKTSMGLMSILREECAHPDHRILLCAFTNRAVDEICSKLVKSKLDFVRVGNALNCAEPYTSHLLTQRMHSEMNIQEAETLLSTTRIFVGTVATLSTQQGLLRKYAFTLAIVDEASQLLEPHLLPLLMATTEEKAPSIHRFVFIGDHKQLPAIVQQSEHESRVTATELHAIGLTDCRSSLFERLIRCAPETCVHHFTRQGRMHPDVAAFANTHFYGGQLTAIPLSHQQTPADAARMLFVPSPLDDDALTSPKTSIAEATIIARICHHLLGVHRPAHLTPLRAADIGIIVPYRHQIALIRRALAMLHNPEADTQKLDATDFTIDTVERFQGSEREVIIYGFTISRAQQFKFLCNARFIDTSGTCIDRKLNVALTRARQQTIIVGHEPLLRQDTLFAALLDSCVHLPAERFL